METEVSTYEQEAIDFLKATGATIEIKFLKHGKHFDDDKEDRDIYAITIKRGQRSFSFNFGNSIAHSGKFLVGYKMANNTVRSDAKRFNDKKEAESAAFRAEMIVNKDFSKPGSYDILACLTKYDPGTLEDFCSEFGYDTDSKKAENIYNAVKDEYQNMARLFTDEELEQLQEIQ